MARPRLLRLSLIGLAGILVVMLVAGVLMGFVLVRRPFPDYSGDVTLPGLKASVAVHRDEHGIPQIYADNPEDLFRAQGYVQAQDQFFQMDWRRHVTAGRLSELVGDNPRALQADKVVRTLGWRRVAAQELDQMAATERGYLEAFAAGVNDYIGGRSASYLSLNYTVLGLSVPLRPIEHWTPLDSLTWFKAMAWDLRGNYDDELARARVFGSVRDVGRVDQLYPPYPYDRHTPILSGEVNPVAATAGSVSGTGSGSASGPDPGSPALSAPGAATRTATTPITRPATRTAPAPTTETAGTSKAKKRATAKERAAAKEQARRQARERAQAGADVSALLRVLGGEIGQQAVEQTSKAVLELPTMLGTGDGIGSNSWVVSGSLTASGKPLLANDPHLAPGIPGIWYQMGLHCRQVDTACPFDVAGYTFAGVPGIVIGHNARIAWGFTNLAPDVTDFYLEQVDGDTYLRDGKQVPLALRTETIEVAGGTPVTIQVRSTVHGPVLSDVVDGIAAVGGRAPAGSAAPARGSGYAVSLAWTALQPGHDAQALFALNRATNFAQFRKAALLMDVPAQNMVYADVDGHIGYQAPGRIPIRRAGLPDTPVPADGSWPMPGWNSAFDWAGYVPVDQLPWVQDPTEGYIVAANQPVVPPGYPVRFTRDWDYGYRSQRIRELIAGKVQARQAIQLGDMQQIEADTHNSIAVELVPLLMRTDIGNDEFTRQGRDVLKGWDYTQPSDSAAAAYFNAVWAAMLDITFADEMPEGTRPNGGGRYFEVVRTLLKDPQDPWWDDRRTPDVVETQPEVLRQALKQARLRLTSILGKDPSRWEWGRLHRLRLTETPLGDLGLTGVLHPLLNQGPIDLGGGSSTVNALGWDAASGTFDVIWGPSMRMIVDLGDFDGSRWVSQTGVSGHPGHDHYADQFDAWAHDEALVWPFTAAAVKAAADDTLTLHPQGSG